MPDDPTTPPTNLPPGLSSVPSEPAASSDTIQNPTPSGTIQNPVLPDTSRYSVPPTPPVSEPASPGLGESVVSPVTPPPQPDQPPAVDVSAKVDPSALADLAKSLNETPATPVVPPTPPTIPPVAGEEEIAPKKRSGGKTSAIIGGLVLLIVLPVTAYYVVQKTNIMANLPFARLSQSDIQEAAARERAGGAVAKKVPVSAPVGGPIASGITHACDGVDHTISDFVISSCPQSGQDCTGSPYQFTVHADAASTLKLTYVTRSTHCSNVSVLISVDGTVKHTTGYISGSISTGAIDLGTVAAGDHTISLAAMGQTGGCNAGFVISWGGSITTNCGLTATPTATETPTGTPAPTSPPSTPGVCDASCDNDSSCSSGFVCATVTGGVKRCRKSECTDQFTCVCPAATATPTPTQGIVVVTATPVVAIATPTPTLIAAAPTPKVPVSGVPSVLGAATVGGGILLLILGLLL